MKGLFYKNGRKLTRYCQKCKRPAIFHEEQRKVKITPGITFELAKSRSLYVKPKQIYLCGYHSPLRGID